MKVSSIVSGFVVDINSVRRFVIKMLKFYMPYSSTQSHGIKPFYTMPISLFSKEIFKVFQLSTTASAIGPDGLPFGLPKLGSSLLLDVMTAFVTRSFFYRGYPSSKEICSHRSHPQAHNFEYSSKQFYSIVIISSADRSIELAIPSQFISSFIFPDDSLQFAYESNRFPLGTVASFWLLVFEKINSSLISISWIFLYYSLALGSTSHFLPLYSLESFRCPVSILLCLKDCAPKRTQQTKQEYPLSSSIPNTSDFLQRAILFHYGSTTHLGYSSTDPPTQLLEYADDVFLCLSIPNQSVSGAVARNLRNILLSLFFTVKHLQVLDLLAFPQWTFANCRRSRSRGRNCKIFRSYNLYSFKVVLAYL